MRFEGGAAWLIRVLVRIAYRFCTGFVPAKTVGAQRMWAKRYVGTIKVPDTPFMCDRDHSRDARGEESKLVIVLTIVLRVFALMRNG